MLQMFEGRKNTVAIHYCMSGQNCCQGRHVSSDLTGETRIGIVTAVVALVS